MQALQALPSLQPTTVQVDSIVTRSSLVSPPYMPAGQTRHAGSMHALLSPCLSSAVPLCSCGQPAARLRCITGRAAVIVDMAWQKGDME